MEAIFKTWKKATYFEGTFKLRDKSQNWACPIDFPTVFTAFGPAIKSGNWQSCTSINTPTYVIDEFFDTVGHNKHDSMFKLWDYCKQLEVITWNDVNTNEERVKGLIRLANCELNKLYTI